ncbi:tetratricopeptide repeat protein [Marinigracilibium pacificum]|uniref:Tetratricopeptide repeat protein n=1 Tax=Marinigracilibium pacificum TaxID=2729599 RepID=A0A848IX34_9BACT|nr:tetratricopeptide repeat protein [Marinigracilibium pacificum]NMM47851.1 tetratricopeptide repeat protein [Marinigracilibium pacificum]
MKPHLVLFFSLILFYCYSQTDGNKENAINLARKAVKLMDNGEIDESIDLLEKAVKLDPSNYIYPYEIGYAYVLKKDYDNAIKYLEKVIKMDGVNDLGYQLLGNTYSMAGNKDKAIKTYNKGLKLFPNSGKLYLELGNVHQDDWLKALEFYEKGILVEPTFPSNYYWASKIFCNSSEEVWGMIYGEIFMNIERGSGRTEEISKLLFDTYQSEIQFTSDSSVSVSFSQNNIVNVDKKDIKIPFTVIYEPTLLLATSTIDSISLNTLNKIRTEFISFYYQKEFNDEYPNIVFDWNKKLIGEGHFESYNYWLLMKGSPEEFNYWISENEDKFNDFIDWFTNNPMPIDSQNTFHRSYY